MSIFDDEVARREIEQAEAEARYINACFDKWPDMRKYADTAEVDTVESLLNGTVKPCVVVRV